MIPKSFIRIATFRQIPAKTPVVPDTAASLNELLTKMRKNLPIPPEVLQPMVYEHGYNPLNNPKADLSDYSALVAEASHVKDACISDINSEVLEVLATKKSRQKQQKDDTPPVDNVEV